MFIYNPPQAGQLQFALCIPVHDGQAQLLFGELQLAHAQFAECALEHDAHEHDGE